MPHDMLTPFGVRPGQVTDEERMNESMRQSAAQQNSAQQELAARLGIARMNNDTTRYGIDRGMEASGTFTQRSGQESSMFDKGAQLQRDMDTSATNRAMGVTGLQMKPSIMREEREQTLFNEGSPLRQARSGLQMGAMDALKNAFSGTAGKVDPDQLDILSLQAAVANDKDIPDVSGRANKREYDNVQMAELKRGIAKTRAQELLRSGDVEGARRFAAENGVPLEINPIEEYIGANPGLVDPIKNMAKGFADRDTAMTGWNPTEQDVASIVGEVTRLKAILQKKGYAPEEADREAKRVVLMNLGDDQNDVNAGWIGTLKSRL